MTRKSGARLLPGCFWQGVQWPFVGKELRGAPMFHRCYSRPSAGVALASTFAAILAQRYDLAAPRRNVIVCFTTASVSAFTSCLLNFGRANSASAA